MDPYDIGRAFAEIEAELIASMIRNMKRHRAEETKEGFQWTQWQAQQLKALEAYKKANKKKYGKKFRSINNMLAEAIKEARAQGNMDQEIEILEALKKGFARYSKADADILGEFFKLNDRKLEALIKATTDDFQKGEQAILRMAEDQYRQIIFNAQVYANTGAGTYEKAVDMATKDFLERGINCIEYSNGARHTMSDYADMAIRTAAKRAYLAGEGEKRIEWGISLVIVNKRGNPCPKCLPFVGKILIDDVYSGGSREDGNYPLLSRAMELGLYHPRCKDSHSTYFEGISTPPDDHFTEKDIEEIKDGYPDEQKRNVAQHNYQKYSRMAQHSLDKENQQKYDARAEYWKGEYSRLYNKAGIDIQLKWWKNNDIFGKNVPIENKLSLEEVKERLSKQVLSLSDIHKDVLQRYTGALATRVNNAIKNNRINAQLQKEIDLLDGALKGGIMPETVVLHRDTMFGWLGLGINKTEAIDDLEKLVNRVIRNTIFTSTSFDDLQLPARDTELVITVPKGYKGCQYLKPVALDKYKHQEEVLFSRGLSYMVKSAKITDNKFIFEVEVLPNE